MTIIIGILCDDGIVMGADSSATLGLAPQMPTIEQKCKKIHLVGDDFIIGGSGEVGLCQRFTYVAEKYWETGANRDKDYQQVGIELTAHSVNNFKATGLAQIRLSALVAFSTKDQKFHLCEFGTNGFQPEFKTRDLWYVSIGSGQTIVDPFLGFLRKAFWGDRPPSIEEGKFCVTWALQHAIELNPGGIQAPMQVAILTMSEADSRYIARMLSEEELLEHEGNVNGIYENLLNYKRSMFEESTDKQIPDINA